MDHKAIEALGKRGLSLMRLSTDEWNALEETRRGGSRFSMTFPHDIAHAGKRDSLALIAIVGAEPGLRVGVIRSVQATSTFDSRVVFDLVRPIRPGSLNALLSNVSERALSSGAATLANGREPFLGVSRKLRERLLQIIASEPANAAVLRRIVSEFSRPKRFENARALQQDAVNLALKAFGDIEGATSIALPGDDTALGTVRLQEDAVIEHDARWIPGWRLDDSDLTGRAVFKRSDAELEVFTANKRPLEELFGVDLIYLNRSRGSLVMVQYKMMGSKGQTRRTKDDPFSYDDSEDQEWTVPIDSQFKDELRRMANFDKDLEPDGAYRLNSGAFFFKLVKRHASARTTGIMLSLGHLSRLITQGALTGAKGGLRISYTELDGHYLRSDAFVALVQSGYVGTRGATTEHLQVLIRAALERGRAVVAAMQSAVPRATGAP